MSRREQGFLVAALAAAGVALGWTAAAPPVHAQVFTEDPLQAQRTPIRALHITQIRSDIDLLLTAKGLARFNWTDLTLAPCSNCVKAAHVTELRSALNGAGGPAPSAYKTDPDPMLVAGVSIQADHLNELRSNIHLLFIAQHFDLTVTSVRAGATTVSGTATPNARVQVFVNGVPRGAVATADAQGRWTVTNLVPALSQNDSVTVRQTVDGVTSDFSAAVVVGPMSTQIAFVHIDGDCSTLATCKENLHLLDPLNRAQPVQLTSFAPGTLLQGPVWSKDFQRLAFASTLNAAHSLEPLTSVFTLDADGENLQQLTGRGKLEPLPGPFRTVTGSLVAAPVNGVPGNVLLDSECMVTAQGILVAAPCLPMGTSATFVMDNVPVGSTWVLARGSNFYNDPTLPVSPIPVFGAAGIKPGSSRIDVGAITMQLGFSFSLQPSPSRDGTQVLAISETLGFVPANCQKNVNEPPLPCWDQGTTRLGEVVRVDAPDLSPTLITAPGLASLIGTSQLSGCDWSPVQDRIACGLGHGILGNFQSTGGLLLMNPDGSNAQVIWQPFNLFFGDPHLLSVEQVRWSPNGTRIAFVLASQPLALGAETDDLLVIDVGSTNPKKLTSNQAGQLIQGISWSPPDGGQIAFDVSGTTPVSILPGVTFPLPTSGNIFTINADGTGRAQLTTDNSSFAPAWRLIP